MGSRKRRRPRNPRPSAACQRNEILQRESGMGSWYQELVRRLRKKSITELWPIQSVAYPLMLNREDVLVRAKTGSGKTFIYLFCLVYQYFRFSRQRVPGYVSSILTPRVMIILPTTDSCERVHVRLMNLLECTYGKVGAALWPTTTLSHEQMLSPVGFPDIVVSTPGCVLSYIRNGVLKIEHLEKWLRMLILDEVDVPLSPSYEQDLKSLLAFIPKSCPPNSCQCAVFSGTPSADVETLKNLVTHNPHIVTLTKKGYVKHELTPYNVQQFYVSCNEEDKLLFLYCILCNLRKALIFTNSNDASCRIKVFLEKCEWKCAVLDANVDANYHAHLFEDFDGGRLQFLIATDDYSKGKGLKRQKKEDLGSGFGVVKGVDFKKVHKVVNFNMPQSVSGYFRRIVGTGRPNNIGASYSLVSPNETRMLQDIKSFLGDDVGEDSKILVSESWFYTRLKLLKGFLDIWGCEGLSWLA